MYESVVQLRPFPLFYRGCFANFFLFRSSDPCGQTEPREDDKSDHSRVSPRLRDNPAVCHLNSFGGGRALAGGKMSEGADRTIETAGREVQAGITVGADRTVMFWVCFF